MIKDSARSQESKKNKAGRPTQICAALFGNEVGAINSLTKKLAFVYLLCQTNVLTSHQYKRFEFAKYFAISIDTL